MMKVISESGTVYQNVVEEYCDEFPEKGFEDLVHDGLECGGYIT